jgi:hypothetical protein
MQENIIEPNSEIPTASDIGNIIPDYMRKIIDSQPGENITGANYLTLTPELEVGTPSGQAVDEGMDLNQVAMEFDSMVNSKLAPDLMEIGDVLQGYSAQSVVTADFSFESLQNIPFTRQVQVNDLDEANVITDENQLTSLLDRISGASLGATQNLFVDADDDDNLIEITPEDAAQGGLRAWGGNDRILGTQDNDIVNGNAGNDKIVGAGGGDLLLGGEGNDLIGGGEGDDLIKGDEGDDYLVGAAGNDVLRGGAGSDVLIGSAGNDILIGGGDADLLRGSEGADQFILCGDTFTNRADLADRILDFNPADEGDMLKIAYLKGTKDMDEIRFAAVDVNTDGMKDTAILSSHGIVGVIMSTDPLNIDFSSILMVGPQDTTLSLIG